MRKSELNQHGCSKTIVLMCERVTLPTWACFQDLNMPKKAEKQEKPLFDGNVGTKQLCHLPWYKSETVKSKLLAIKNLFALKLDWLNLFGFLNT